MRPSYSAPEAPTHLRPGDLPPGLLDDVDPSRSDRPRSASRHGSAPSYSDQIAPRRKRAGSASWTRRRSERGELDDDLPVLPPVDDHSIVSPSRHSSSASVPRRRPPTEPVSDATPRESCRRIAPGTGSSPALAAPADAHDRATPNLRGGSGGAAAPLAAPIPPTPMALPPPPAGPMPAQRPTPAAAQAQPQPRPTPAPQPPPPSAAEAEASSGYGEDAAPAGLPPFIPPPVPGGIGSIDPLAIPTPPELAGPIYGHIRRLALQADLAGADRVLRDALAELSSSLSCTIVYPGQDGMWTLGSDDEIPRDAQPLVAVATARRAMIGSHIAMIPVITTTETVAVITLVRNARQPAYQLVEQIAMVALCREAAPILHHLAVQHLQRASEIKADKGSLYRGEALEAHRNRGQEGQVVQLTPGWVARAYPLLAITVVVALGFAIFVRVPTYAEGTGVVTFEGSTSVTATTTGTVDKVLVKENDAVKKGDALVKLSSPDDTAALGQAETDWRDLQVQFLFDQTDEQIRRQLSTAATQRAHQLARVEARTIRAPRDGVVTNLHVKEGIAIQPGSYVMQITDENSEIEVLGFLPSKDSPRIRGQMPLQLDLDGYKKARVLATITHVQPDAVSGSEAAKLGGEMLQESIARELQANPTTATWISVRARLPARTFKAERTTYHYHHGMHAKVEIKIKSKPFLSTLLPVIEKWLPD